MARPDNAHRLQVLRDGGRVTIPVRRSRLFVGLFGSVGFAAIGAVMIVVAVSQIPRLGPIALLSRAFIIGVLAVLVFGCWFATSAIRQLLHPRRLIVGPEGLEFESLHNRTAAVGGFVAWSEIVEFFGQRVGGRWPFRGTLLCCYRLTTAAARNTCWSSWSQPTSNNLAARRSIVADRSGAGPDRQQPKDPGRGIVDACADTLA